VVSVIEQVEWFELVAELAAGKQAWPMAAATLVNEQPADLIAHVAETLGAVREQVAA
jgi:hypothetical protein